MRHILIVARPPGCWVPLGWKPDHALWRSTLPNLKSLRLVALEPVVDMNKFEINTFEEEMDVWLMWINPFLMCFGQYLQELTLLEVDVDNRRETAELVKGTLPSCSSKGTMLSSRRSRLSQRALFHHRLRAALNKNGDSVSQNL